MENVHKRFLSTQRTEIEKPPKKLLLNTCSRAQMQEQTKNFQTVTEIEKSTYRQEPVIKTKDIEIEKSTYRQEPVIKKKNIDECRDKLRTECYENENRSMVSVTKKKNKDTE